MEIEFSENELEIIKKAVNEYEENHYESEDMNWQRIINRLMDRIGVIG